MIVRPATWIASLVISLALLNPAQAAQESVQASEKKAKPQAPTIEEIRQAYNQRRDQDVIVLADRALHDITMLGDVDERAGELHFWRGASLRRLGRDKEALVALEEAKALGFNRSELYLELALVKRTQGDKAGAEEDYQVAQTVLPSDLYRDQLIDRWNREGKDEPRFKLVVSPQVGYDSNIVGLDPSTPLSQGNTTFDSGYVGAFVDARWYLWRDHHQTLELDYQGLFREYPSSSSLSFADNLMSVLGRQPLSEFADLEVRASLEEAFMRTDGHFRTARTVGPGAILYPLPDLQLHLFGDWSSATYYDPTSTSQDRDGDTYRIGLEAAMDLGRGWAMGSYLILSKANTKGSDYDARGWDVGLIVRPEEFWGCKASVSVDVSEQNYLNANSLTNFTEKRNDRPIQATLAVVFKQVERWIGYAPALSFTYVNHYSNIHEYRYSRYCPQIEMGINVLSW